jgi:hypothetical protein
MISLPRQAQDKYSNIGKALKKEYRFLAEHYIGPRGATRGAKKPLLFFAKDAVFL